MPASASRHEVRIRRSPAVRSSSVCTASDEASSGASMMKLTGLYPSSQSTTRRTSGVRNTSHQTNATYAPGRRRYSRIAAATEPRGNANSINRPQPAGESHTAAPAAARPSRPARTASPTPRHQRTPTPAPTDPPASVGTGGNRAVVIGPGLDPANGTSIDMGCRILRGGFACSADTAPAPPPRPGSTHAGRMADRRLPTPGCCSKLPDAPGHEKRPNRLFRRNPRPISPNRTARPNKREDGQKLPVATRPARGL